MLIVEGPDGSGKSTLVKQLKQALGLMVADKAVDENMKAKVDIKQYIETHLTRGFRPVVFDRFAMISGPIYGVATDMKPPNDIFKYGPSLLHWFEMMRAVDPIVIYCLPPSNVVRENVLRERSPKELAVWNKVYWSYWFKAHQDLAEKPRRTQLYDYEVEDPKNIARWAQSAAGGQFGTKFASGQFGTGS